MSVESGDKPIGYRGFRNNPVILLVDDDQDQLDLFAAVLELQNACVIAVNCAKDAELAFANNHIELVLTDINMPFVDGITLIESLRRLPESSRLPIAAFSADTSHIEAEVLSSGADAFFYKTKPKEMINELTVMIEEVTSLQ
jgi:CheY-like chemotaxis protein